MLKVNRLVLYILSCLQLVTLLLRSFCLTHALATSGAPNQHGQLLVFGLGPVGRAVAKRALATANDVKAGDVYGGFDAVYGTIRSPDGSRDDGINRLLFSREKILQVLPSCTHVLITIPPQPKGDSVETVWSEMENYLPRGTWLGFISTTGVYGDHGGATVTEESPLLSEDNSNAARYREAEKAWKARAEKCGWRVAVFRCAGIYGPGRSALHTLFKKGYTPEVIAQLKKTVTNRIHENDIARAVVASMVSPCVQEESSFKIYNIADDEPENRYVVMRYAAQLLERKGVPIKAKEQEGPFESERSRRRGTDQKRVSNKRMETELLREYGGLEYPTYREGLASLLTDPSSPWLEAST